MRICDSHITGRPDVGYIKFPLVRMPTDGTMTAWLPVQVWPARARMLACPVSTSVLAPHVLSGSQLVCRPYVLRHACQLVERHMGHVSCMLPAMDADVGMGGCITSCSLMRGHGICSSLLRWGVCWAYW